ncbi:PA14 domain-containing protein [Telluribacter sp. SYSU D00476]|uniref:PA14 domain-containing protein n=1 Tax=Telluribacter sp. SYSU D00476 TaxID=2811430 RepID=UPI001FF6AD59|nr:PA14 domain-containing protein [Telluribacter sp. SYSU D00476]
MKTPEGNIHLGGWQFRMFSYSKQSTIDRAKGFVGEVLGRYRSLINENRLLFVSVTTGTSQELEYNYSYDLDYSDDMVNQYREWHKNKYCTDPMVAPRDFNSEQGKRWYTFRHKKLKEFIDQMAGHIKSFDSRIKVVLDFGSSFDGMSRRRGTMAFKDLTEKVDGLKVNDDYTYDHRFSMDILRGSLPGKWIMNEVLPYDDRFYLIPEFINSSYAHGAKVFCVVTGDPFKLYAMASVYTQVRDQWIAGSKGTMSPLPTTGSVNYNFSDIFNANFSYNRFTTATGRNIYQEWLDQYNKNPSNAKAVNVSLDDSGINDNAACGTCTPPAAPVLTANPSSITNGQSTTLTASGFSGTVTWSTGQTGSSISVNPGQTTTYTASCSINGCTSPNASITVTVNAPAPVQEPPVNCTTPATGYATRKRWTNIGGKTISDLANQTNNFNKAPNTTSNLTELRTETNWGDAYGQQIQGYITAPQTGSYTFWISSDDHSELWLSTSEDPAGMQRIARVTDWTNPLQWDKESNQKSVTINLTACQRYYFEIRHKDGDWWDNLAVGWSKPGQSTSAPAEIVPGSVLSPYTSSAPVCTPPSAPSLSASASSITAGQSTTLSASNCSGTVTWSTGQTGSSISVSPAQTTTYTATCSANGCTSSNGSVTVTVNAPVQAPAPAPEQQQPISGGCVVNKVRLVFRTDCCFHRLNGARLQGSNDQNSWTNLYNFTTDGNGKWQEFSFSNSTSYRYVRFVAAPNSAGELVELEFYNGVQKLSGTVFGSSGNFNNDPKYSFQRAMDGAVGEMWHGASQGTHNFVGLDLSSCSSTACTPPSAPSLSASASSITAGQSTTLSASNCSGTVTWSTGQTGSSISVSPAQTTTYTATCSANGCTSSNGSVTVTVNAPVCTPPSAPSLSASASSITAGQSTTLSASNCSGTVTWSTGQTGSSISVNPGQTTTYTATCSANGCTSSNGSVTVTVNAPAPAPEQQPVSGSCVVNKVRLVFRTDCCFHRLNGARLQGSNDQNSWTNLYNFTTDGNGKWQEFSFSNSTSYRYVRFVAAPNSAGELVELEFYNGGQKLSGTVFGSSGNFNNDPKYSFQRAMDGAVGEMWHGASQGTHNFVGLDLSSCSSTACTPPSAPSLSASASSITAGQSTTLTASNCSGTVTWSTGHTGSSISVSPGQTTTYTATCSANGCTSSNGSVTVTVNTPAAEQNNNCNTPAAGYATRKRWTGIGGTSISDLANQTNSFTKAPNTTSNLTELRTETNWGDAYGQQIQGYITAPQTGSYTFWISSDDNSELWLSTSEDPAGMQRIARVTGWTDPLQWNRESNQKSATINLTACQRYYFEIRHKEGEGGDNLAVGWSKPGQSTSAPAEIVPGSVLSPYTSSNSACVAPAAPVVSANVATITAGQSTTLTASGCTGTISWSNGQSGNSISVSPGQTSSYTATCNVNGCTSPGASVTVTVTNADRTDANTNCSTLEGFLDVADCGIISGWVYDRSNPNAVLKIDIYDNFNGATLIQSGITAGNFRQDLLNAGKGNGNHGFQISTPAQLKNGQNRNISVRVNGCSYTLSNSFKVFQCSSNARTGAEEEEEVKEVSMANTELKVVSDQRMAAWPNPTKGELEVSFYVEEQKEAVLSVVDMMGVSRYEQKIKGAGQHQEKIDLSHSAEGIYIIQLKKANSLETKKIIVTH